MILVAAIGLLALVLLVAGFEMLMVLGLPTLAVKTGFYASMPDMVLAQKLTGGINQSLLLAIPFFLFAAELMGHGQIAGRLTALVRSVIGHARGGMGYTTIGASIGFGSVSGSAPATVAAMGHIIYPELRKSGFRDRFALGLIVSSAETALLIPPSITLIIYGWLTGTSITTLFAAGLGVGLLLGFAFSVLTAIEAYRSGVKGGDRPTVAGFFLALREAIWALGMPLVILGGIYGGFFTPTEAAAVSVVYAIFVEMLIYRTLNFRQLCEVAERSAIQTSVIFLLLALGSLLAYFITLAQIPNTILVGLDAIQAGPILFLIIANVVFIIAGMFVDPNSIQLILVPPLFPVAVSLGIDPVHFGMIVALNVTLGMITPPFGLDLFVASSSLRKPVAEIIAGIWPFILVNIVVLLLVTYVPGFTALFAALAP
ncbi:TRAP transporter large permease [Aquicoccus sp. G2-2]|jgi:C4-dicarboxylate transporter DctM subunit|uniref:TRAP transporter large permease n=1 Tax=Aquicoccus sp. G2-2 TaxID=3092120 RepID=UPI002ADF1F33|nr:TRAP transporter large permease [Aquicoccus sp. G2-2]MEA1113918.1 TRAP transporter large permease [Aquicoccus sp. G2-2]